MSTNNSLRNSLVAVFAAIFFTVSAFGQTLKNGGTFVNNGTASYTAVQNYKTAAGTLKNKGTFSTTGAFTNQNAGLNGTVQNFNGAAGTMTIGTNLDNAAAGATFDNDSAGYVAILRVGGTITNTGGTFDTDSGEVEYNGAGAQSVLAVTYGSLKTSGGNTKTVGGNVTVNDSLRIAASTTFSISTDSLALLGNGNYNAGTFTASSGRVNYGRNGDQSVLPTTYKSLYLSGSSSAHTKTSASGISFAASGLLSIAANDTFDVQSGVLDLNANTPAFTNNSAVKIGGDATFHDDITTAGTFWYYGAGSQNVGGVTYSDLVLSGAGGKVFPNDTVAVTGAYTIQAGTAGRDYTSNTNIFQFAGSSTQNVTGLDADTFYKLEFRGSGAKNLSGTTLGASKVAVLTGSGTVTNDITTVTLTNLSSVSLTIASGTTLANSTGKEITMNGDLENDGTVVNDGTISVY